MFSTALSYARQLAIRLHWTAYLAAGWLLGAWPLLGGNSIPPLQGLSLAGSLIALMMLAGLLLRAQFKRFELENASLSFGPFGPHLPEMASAVPRKLRAALAITTPAIFLSAGLATLPFLIRAGGMEGVLAAWDWWSWDLVAARFAILSLCLAVLQALPLYPLSGAHLLQATVGDARLSGRLSQLLAVGLGIVFWAHPLILIFAAYSVLAIQHRLHRMADKNSRSHRELALISQATISN